MSEVYLAGKLASDELSIADFSDELEQRGHTVLEKWWESEKLPVPYLDNVSTSSPAAKAMIDAAYESDVAILFPSERILGAAVEFGAAIASTKTNHDKLVVVVNPYETRQSIFYAHESVVAVRDIFQVRDMDWF